MDHRSMPSEYGYSSFENKSASQGPPIDKFAIFSKMAETTAMEFQQFMGTISLNKIASMISSLK
jgi:hypothetical protein